MEEPIQEEYYNGATMDILHTIQMIIRLGRKPMLGDTL
jgi:hypothetical protein